MVQSGIIRINKPVLKGEKKVNLKKFGIKKYTIIAIYVVVTYMVIYLLTRFTDNLGGVFSAIGTGLEWAKVIISPIIGGFAMAYILFPIVNMFEKLFKKFIMTKKLKSVTGLAVASTAIVVIAVLSLLGSLIISTITHNVQFARTTDFNSIVTSVGNTMNSFYTFLNEKLASVNVSSDQLNGYIQLVGEKVANFFKDWGNDLIGSVGNITGAITRAIFAIIFAVYFLLDGKKLMAYWDRVLKAVSSARFYKNYHTFIHDADTVFAGYIRGQLMDAVFMMVVVSILLSVVGVKFAVIIGLLTGLANLIPYAGPFVGYGSTALVCVLGGDYKKLLIGIIIIFIIQTLDGNVINPKLLSNSINIHPLLVTASLIIGGAIGGLLGMILAVPCGALVKVYFEKLINYLLKKRKMNESLEDELNKEDFEKASEKDSIEKEAAEKENSEN